MFFKVTFKMCDICGAETGIIFFICYIECLTCVKNGDTNSENLKI